MSATAVLKLVEPIVALPLASEAAAEAPAPA